MVPLQGEEREQHPEIYGREEESGHQAGQQEGEGQAGACQAGGGANQASRVQGRETKIIHHQLLSALYMRGSKYV